MRSRAASQFEKRRFTMATKSDSTDVYRSNGALVVKADLPR
jgi:hypothetical protein